MTDLQKRLDEKSALELDRLILKLRGEENECKKVQQIYEADESVKYQTNSSCS